MKKGKKIKRTVLVISAAVVLLLAAFGIWYALDQRNTHEFLTQLKDMSFENLLEKALENKKEACVTVGVLKDGQMSYEVYGEDGKLSEQTEYRYEIGSVTKTMTAALTSRAVLDEKLQLTDTIDKYLELPDGKVCPTIEALLTHTSGLEDSDYYEWSMLPYVFNHEENPFNGVTREAILEEYRSTDLKESSEYEFNYSNYGFVLLGLVLEEAYDTEYTSLLNEYLADELSMKNTYISNGDADFEGNWQWESGNPYIPAGAVVSDITDMMLYAQAQLSGDPVLTLCHQPLKKVIVSDEWTQMAGFGTDEIGMSWMIDTKNGIIWHNGGTGVHSSYIGFCPEKNTAVVVLSNLSQDEGIPATTIGFKKLLDVSSVNT